MMQQSWRSQWAVLSRRMDGLVAGSRFLIEINSGPRPINAVEGVGKQFLVPAAKRLFSDLEAFASVHASQLGGATCDFLKESFERIRSMAGNFDELSRTISGLTGMIALRAEFEGMMADSDFPRRALVERAFMHLQRSIVADSECQRRWQLAYEDGEPACERSGRFTCFCTASGRSRSTSPENEPTWSFRNGSRSPPTSRSQPTPSSSPSGSAPRVRRMRLRSQKRHENRRESTVKAPLPRQICELPDTSYSSPRIASRCRRISSTAEFSTATSTSR